MVQACALVSCSARRAPGMLACIVLVLAGLALFASTAEASPLPSQTGYFNELEVDPDTDAVLEVLARLGQTLIRARDMDNFRPGNAYSAKRGLDLGLSRGFSGSQAAKHLMGLAAANYAGGPGRRRRSDSTD